MLLAALGRQKLLARDHARRREEPTDSTHARDPRCGSAPASAGGDWAAGVGHPGEGIIPIADGEGEGGARSCDVPGAERQSPGRLAIRTSNLGFFVPPSALRGLALFYTC